MSSSTIDTAVPRAVFLTILEDRLELQLEDGRGLSIPLVWFPRLLRGTEKERRNWLWIGNGTGIHWPELDEDLSVAHLLAGHRSRESAKSLEAWLKERDT